MSTTSRRPWLPTAVAAGGVAVLTAAVAVLPFLRFAYRAPGLHIALDAADAVIALVVAYLVYGRYRQTGRLRELLLATCMTILAAANLPLAAIPAAVEYADGAGTGEWSALLVRTLGAALFAAASLTPPGRRVTRAGGRRWALGGLALTVLLAGCGAVLARLLSEPVDPDLVLDASRPFVGGHPVVLLVHAVALVLYAVAAVAFSRAALRENDELLRWVGAAAVLAAGARVHYSLFPSLYSDYLYTGDVLRLGFYLLLLLGAAREIESYWTARVVAAEARGRRGTAAELEDLVLPGLREVVRLTQRLGARPDSGRLDAVAQAARRALADVEQVFEDVRLGAEAALQANPFETSLRDALTPMAARLRIELEIRVEPGVDVPPDPERVIALAAEVVRSAAREAGAECVRVEVQADPLRLVVVDDGAGDDGVGSAAEDPRGLRRLQAVAAQQDAVLDVQSTLLGGTTVTVRWP